MRLKTRHWMGLLLLLGIVVAYRWDVLSLPHYWDDAWVYAPAVHAMVENGPSLLPDAIPVHLSRGHPLFFHALYGVWGTVFGTSLFSLHSLSLLIALSMLVAVFFLLQHLCGSTPAWIGTIWMASRGPFLAQSTLVLPEILLALLVLLAIYRYLKQQFWWYWIAASALLLVKESGVLLVLVIIPISWFFERQHSHKNVPLQWWKGGTPLLTLGLFFLLQYLIQGWVFFPEHMDMIQWDTPTITSKLQAAYRTLFEDQKQPLIWQFLMVSIMFMDSLSLKKRVVLALSLIAIPKVLFGLWPVADVLLLPTLLLLPMLSLYLLVQSVRSNKMIQQAVLILGAFIIVYSVFTAINFFTNRYLIVLFPALITLVLCVAYGNKQKQWSSYPLHKALLVFVIGYSVAHLGSERGGDCSVHFSEDIRCQQQMIAYLQEHKDTLAQQDMVAPFLYHQYLRNPHAGYVDQPFPVESISIQAGPETDLIITNSIEALHLPADFEQHWQLRHQESVGMSWARLFVRRPTGL